MLRLGICPEYNYDENERRLRDAEEEGNHPRWGVLIERINRRRMLRDAVEEDILGDETGEMNEENA
jgi:hypothetical protein